jgi:tol-pal system protein YbgF
MNEEIIDLQKTVANLKMENDELDRKIAVNKENINVNSEAISDINNDVTYLTNEISLIKERFKMSGNSGGVSASGKSKSEIEQSVDNKSSEDESQIIILEDDFTDKGSLYSYAYELYKSGKYYESRQKFNEFLSLYPKDDLADNAKYWIAETYYSQNEYENCISTLEELLEKYPEGNKVPAAYLKMGLAYKELGETQRAVETLKKLEQKFPASDEAGRAVEFLARWE